MEPARVRFGPFELDRRSGELSKFGRKLRLQDQPFQILVLLLDRPGDVITREELQQKLWPRDTFVDFDHGLNNAIKRLREALSDSAEKPRYVETLPRRGYRFVAALETVASQPGALPIATPAAQVAVVAGRSWRRPLIVGAVVLIAVLGTAAFIVRRRVPAAPVIHSIAVLPLDNLSGDPAQDYFADGITDALTTELAQVGSLRVISRTSAMQYKGVKKPLRQIGQELNVDAVVEGSVRRDKDRVWITAQLIDASRDRHLWAQSYEREVGDLPALQGEIASDLIHRTGSEVTPDEQARLSSRVATNPQAYDLYLRARLHAGLEDLDDNQAAIDLLERAVALDPRFAAAYAALSNAYRIRGSVLGRDQEESEEKASAAVEKALTLDPRLADGYVARGYLLWSLSNHYPHERAAQDYRYALSLNPNLAEAHHQLANVYNHVGMLDQGLKEAQEAVALDPLNTGARFRIGVNLLYQGRYEESLAAIRDSERFFPALWAFQTSFALFQLGKREEAAALLDEFQKKYPKDPGGILTSMQGLLAAAAGDPARAEERIRRAIKIGQGYQHFHHTAYVIASAYAVMNKPDQALKFLRIAADDGFPCYPLFEKDPDLDHLRKDPRFIRFMAELHAQWEHYKTAM
jgi:TolB-like protein/DNA-binding winged helix-turn-helix (wHTH) protein/Flp pilus assembly protein TadD